MEHWRQHPYVPFFGSHEYKIIIIIIITNKRYSPRAPKFRATSIILMAVYVISNSIFFIETHSSKLLVLYLFNILLL